MSSTYGRSVFAVVREQVSLVEAAGKYTDLTPSGVAFKGRCPHPDHEDQTPSFHVYPDCRFYCFGCGWHGDVTDLHQVTSGIASAYEAAVSVAGEFGISLPDFSESTCVKARERRDKRGVLFDRASRSHRNLDDCPEVVRWWEERGFDEGSRVRFLLGADASGAVTIPLWYRGEVHGIIRRNLEGRPKYLLPRKEDLLDGYRSLFVPGNLGKSICLVEGFLDALALDLLGFSAVAVGGTEMSKVQLEDLKNMVMSHESTVYVMPDADEAGARAARRWVTNLYPYALLCVPDYGLAPKNGATDEDEETKETA